MMLTYKDIIKEGDPRLRQKSLAVTLPLTEEDLKLIKAMNEYLEVGYDDEKAATCGIRPGVGLSAVQLGLLKQIIVIYAYNEKGEKFHYAFVNPKIISHSVETVYLPGGEGCLSIEREINGLVHRPRRVKLRAQVYDFQSESLNEQFMSLEGYLSLVFQHEYDHLNGILFIDRIDKVNPFFIPDNSSPIKFNQE